MDDAQFKERIDLIFSSLDEYDYFELLKLSQTAPPDEIRTAFHRMAMTIHPDRFLQHPDADLRSKIYAIYKRMAEGYRVLMDASTRKQYIEGLAAGQLRYTSEERKKTGPKRDEDAIEHPQAKKFFLLGLAAEKKGDAKTARMNFKFAMDLIGEHPVIKQHLDKLEPAKK